MGQDYHIYIHTQYGSNGSNKKPSQAKTKPTTSFHNKNNGDVGSKKEGGSNRKGLFATTRVLRATGGVLKGSNSSLLYSIGKKVPYVAIAMAVVKIADTTINTSLETHARYSGNYNFSIGYTNVKNTLSAIINPIGFAMTLQNRWLDNRNHNIKREMQTQLVGSSITNLNGRNV